jgi:hypothetical protein
LRNEQEILKELKHDWDIDSVEQHAKGYWDYSYSSFDLRLLKTTEELIDNELHETYLTITRSRILINISEDESFYEVEDLKEKSVNVTCYFQDRENKHELIKIATFKLSRK